MEKLWADGGMELEEGIAGAALGHKNPVQNSTMAVKKSVHPKLIIHLGQEPSWQGAYGLTFTTF